MMKGVAQLIIFSILFVFSAEDEPEVTIDGDQEQFIAKGEKFTLICRYNASLPASRVQWKKDGKVIAVNANKTNSGSRVTDIFYNESLSQLLIASASSQDSGNYICNVTNTVNGTTDSTSIVIQEKPSTKLQPETVTVKEGENVTLFCNSSGSSLTITWKFNGSNVTTSGDSRISFSDDNRHLIITNVSRVNKGEYKCVASNKVGNYTSNVAFVSVEFGPEISKPPTSRTKEEGHTVEFSCVVAGYPTPDVAWTKNGVELNLTRDVRLNVSSNNGNHHLTISNVQQLDAGQYRCVAKNSLDTATSSPATLSVQFAPEVTIIGDQKRYLANGTDLLLTCQFKALPTVSEVQWVKDGIVIASTLATPLNGSREPILHQNESHAQLSIIAVSLENAGNYTCNVTNNVGSSLNWTSIVIQVTPSIEQDPKASPIKEGENLTLFCSASGSSLRISWEKNGSDVNSSEDSRILLSRENVQLTIVNVRKTDKGAYQCVASNEVGVATSNAAIVNVQFGSEISEPPIDNTKMEGQTIVFSCLVAGYPTPAVAWTKNGVELNVTANLRLSVSSKDGNHTLKITDVQKSDAGQYRCVAKNSLQTSESSPSTLTVQFAPEVTIDGDQIHYVANSTDLQLTCRFHALPPASEVQWLNNGNVIASTLSVPSNGSRATISHHNESQAQLLITTVSLEDAGNYTCNVTNVVGSSSNWTLIIVQVTPVIETHPQADPIKEGENLTLFCNAAGSSLTISWTKNGSAINPNEDVQIRLSTDKEQLTITNVSRKDNGVYRCVASNKVGNATSIAAIVTVRFAPEISQSPRDTTELEGQTAVFNCVVAGYPTPDVAWEKNRVELNVAAHARLSGSFNNGNHQLIISNVQQSDAGQYRCVANNSLDTATSFSATLTVHFDPEVKIDGDKEKIVAKGDDIKVTCQHKALPPVAEVQWIKDGEVISTNSTKMINNSRLDILHFNESLIQLSISAAIVADSGNYTCNVTNIVNSSSDSTSIIVEVKPSVITQPKSAAPEEGDTVKLYCNATGSPILHISWTFDGSVITANGNSRISLSNDSQELTITSVKRGDSGDYRCLVKNSVGNDTSDPSLINVLYQPEIITHPKNVTVEEGLPMTLFCNATGNPPPTLSWTKDGSPINNNQGIPFSGDNKTLFIASINRSESGNYRCVARNGLGNDLSNPAKVDVQFAPEIVENPKDVTMVEGEHVVFSCMVDGNPSPGVTWTKNEEKLNITVNQRLTASSLNNKHNLIITDVHRSDSGQYRCVIINSVGNITSSPGDLNVQFPPEFISSPQNVTVIEEQNVNLTLDCTVYGNPTPDVKWTKDGHDLSENQRINVSDFEGNTSSLTITKLVRGDEGQYRCMANNSVNTTTSAPGKLIVNFRADVKISGSEPKFVEINKQIHLTCQYNASPSVSEVQWVKDGNVIARNGSGIGNGSVNMTKFTESQSQLLISSSTTHDEGNYTCFVTNTVGNSSDTTPVFIQITPAIDTHPQADPVKEGENLTLFCNATGSSLTISWTKNGSSINPNEDVRIRLSPDNEQLTIRNVSRTDNGAYRCVASNKVGNATSNATTVTVRLVPDPPQTLTVDSKGSRVVNISWTAGFDGNSAIENFTVEISADNQIFKGVVCQGSLSSSACVVSSSSRKASLTGLLPWTTYNIRMFATNTIGQSNSSHILNVTTDEEVPKEAPTFDVIIVNSTAVNVSWQMLSKDKARGAILGYYVLHRVKDTPPWTNESVDGAEKTSLLVGSLNEHTTYEFAMQAFNSKGVSNLSALVEKTTDQHRPSGPPQHVTLSDVTSKSINVSWDPVPADDRNGIILGYKLNYRALPNHGIVTEFLNISSEQQDEGGTKILQTLDEFINYSVSVLAFTIVGDGPPSVAKFVQTLEDRPGAPPQNVQGYNTSSTSINVTWNEVLEEKQHGDIIRYTVMLKKMGSVTYKSVKVTPIPRNFELRRLNRFTFYDIKVSASTRVGNGPASNPIKVQTDEDVPSAAPELVSVQTLNSTSIQIEWLAVPEESIYGIPTRYTIYYANSDGKVYTKVVTPVNVQNTYQEVVSGLKESTEYSFQVSLSTAKGEGPLSVSKSSATKGGLPITKTTFAVNVTEGESVSLNCTLSGDGSYTWERQDGTELENAKRKVRGGGRLLEIIDTAIADSGNYTCKTGRSSHTITLQVLVEVKVEMALKVENYNYTKELENKSSPQYKAIETNFTKEMDFVYRDTPGYIRTDVLKMTKGSVVVDFNIIIQIVTTDPKNETTINDKKVSIVQTTIKEAEDGFVKRLKVSKVIPKTEPPEPNGVEIFDIKSDELSVRWKPSEDAETFDVRTYSVQYRAYGEKTYSEHNQTANTENADYSYRIKSLESETVYMIRVGAVNTYGSNFNEETGHETEPAPFAWWIIVLAVLGVLLILGILIGIIIYRRRRARDRREQTEARFQALENQTGSHKGEVAAYHGENVKGLSYSFKNTAYKPGEMNWEEFPHENIKLLDELGSGAFGIVFKGELQQENGNIIPCAVKTLKPSATKVERKDLYNELDIMANVGHHPNLVNLIGACTQDDLLLVIIELAENGCLLDFLKQSRQQDGNNTTSGLTEHMKTSIAVDVARGMAHLARCRCIHRDLAARNVLLGKDYVAKVSDYGMARDVYEQLMYKKETQGKLPVKWMAVESLETYTFTMESDVWAYGVLLWEIESGGLKPYAGLSTAELIENLKNGYRMEKPNGCSDEMYQTMRDCWNSSPSARPNFDELVVRLESTITT